MKPDTIPRAVGFVIGMAGWIYILYEIFSGEAGRAAAKSGNKPFVTAFNYAKNDCCCRMDYISIRLYFWLLKWWCR